MLIRYDTLVEQVWGGVLCGSLEYRGAKNAFVNYSNGILVCVGGCEEDSVKAVSLLAYKPHHRYLCLQEMER